MYINDIDLLMFYIIINYSFCHRVISNTDFYAFLHTALKHRNVHIQFVCILICLKNILIFTIIRYTSIFGYILVLLPIYDSILISIGCYFYRSFGKR